MGLRGKIQIIGGISSAAFPHWMDQKTVGKNQGNSTVFGLRLRQTLSPLHIEYLEGKHYWRATFNIEELDVSRLDIPYWNDGLWNEPETPLSSAIFILKEDDLPNAVMIAEDFWRENRSSLFVRPPDLKLNVDYRDWLFGICTTEELDHAVRYGSLNVDYLCLPQSDKSQYSQQLVALLPSAQLSHY
jgi:hypothetical protein